MAAHITKNHTLAAEDPKQLILTVICFKNCPGRKNSKPPLGNSRTKIARAILAHGTPWKNSLGEYFGEK